jgi:hypothetical protein
MGNNLQITVNGVAGASMVSIFNVTGKLVQNVVLKNRNVTVLEHTLANGIYFAKLHFHGKQILTTHFLVVR